MTPVEAMRNTIEEIVNVVPEDAEEIIEGLRLRGYEIVAMTALFEEHPVIQKPITR